MLYRPWEGVWYIAKQMDMEVSWGKKIFVTEKAVKQGSLLSPLLFIIVMDMVAKKASHGTKGYTLEIKNLHPKEIPISDDLLLTASNVK